MTAHTASSDTASRDPLSLAKGVAIGGALILLLSVLNPSKLHASRWALIVPIVVAAASRIWALVVTHFVPKPYLDEVFHIPQAQKYCEGRFREWDDKITTPPGLYLISTWFPENELIGALTGLFDCSVGSLRASSALGLVVVTYLAMRLRHTIETLLHEGRSSNKPSSVSWYTAHTALNIALFPLLFFFSGLYYTDVVSTAVVLAGFVNCLARMSRDKSPISSDLLTICIGVAALFMRQTNFFWIVVFNGGLEAVHAVRTLRPTSAQQPPMNILWERLKWFAWRYSVGDVHDPPLYLAWPGDMLFTAISLLVAAVWNLPVILAQIWPYVTVLVSFIYFIVWNGGVVLGDKSNHVATIHLAQMLYIWPLFAFFSLPLVLPYLVAQLFTFGNFIAGSKKVSATSATRLSDFKTQKPAGDESLANSNSHKSSWALGTLQYISERSILPWLCYLLSTVVLSLGIVHFNTIIHPFTLADNRHYMFYIFRYTIRRAWWVKYALIVPYTLSRWLIWGTLECSPGRYLRSPEQTMSRAGQASYGVPFFSHPFRDGPIGVKAPSKTIQTDAAQVGEALAETQSASEHRLKRDPLSYSTGVISTSTALIFLLATTLSLVTAPLVEPRYFIIPWVLWRLLVPAWRLGTPHDDRGTGSVPSDSSVLARLMSLSSRYDLRLVLETAWFLVINLVTGWIFLMKPYQWRAEDGTLLDEGLLQRFMW